MPDRTVTFRSVAGASHDIVGSDRDRGVLLSIEHHDGRYAEALERAVASRLARDAVVLDVGANIGVVTVLLADLVPAGRVVAFEPARENLRYLHRNVAGRTNVEVVEAAVGAADGTLRFDANDAYPAGAHVADDGAELVACRSLDSWAADQRASLRRLDLVKIDVEGAEPQVLEGAAATLARFRPTVVLECNAAALRRVSGTGAAELRRQLAAIVPHVGVLRGDGSIDPVDTDDDLDLVLGTEGVVDLVGGWRAPGLRTRLRARRRHAAIAERLRAPAPPEPHNFVVSAPVAIEVEGPLRGAAGTELDLRVRVVNGSRWWLSSAFVYHPVNVGARWSTAEEAARAPFPEPVPPGASATVTLPVRLPDDPGRRTLEITLVQEHFAWLVDLDPRCVLRVEVDVAPPAEPAGGPSAGGTA